MRIPPFPTVVARVWFCLASLFLVSTSLSAAVNPDPCPDSSSCSSWVCELEPVWTSSLNSGPSKVCPNESTATWVVGESFTKGKRTFTVPGRPECDEEKEYGLQYTVWTWTITGPIDPQSGAGMTATLDNSNPQPGSYNITWTGVSDKDDECCTGTMTNTYNYTFTIPGPAGTASADPAAQTVCVYGDGIPEDLLGEKSLTKTIVFTYTNSDTECDHKMRWQLSGGGQGVTIDNPTEGTGTTATATVRIPASTPDCELSFTCSFISEVTGSEVAKATATIKIETPKPVHIEPELTVKPIPDNTKTVEACMAFTGDFAVQAIPKDGADKLVCPSGEEVVNDPISLFAMFHFWNGAGGLGFGPSQHVVLTGPGASSVSCRVFAFFIDAKGKIYLKMRQERWRINVYKWQCLERPSLKWKKPPFLKPNPAAPGDLVQVLGEAESKPGKKRCGPNQVSPIPVTAPTFSFKLPDDLDPVNPELWIETDPELGTCIRVGPNAKGSYKIKCKAEAFVVDPMDTICGDIKPLESTVSLVVKPAEIEITGRRRDSDEWSKSNISVAAGGINANPHIASVKIKAPIGSGPTLIRLSGINGFSTGNYWWWGGEYKRDPVLYNSQETLTPNDGKAISISAGTEVIMTFCSGNAVGGVTVTAKNENSEKSLYISCDAPSITLTQLDKGTAVNQWRQVDVQLMFQKEPVPSHEMIVACRSLVQPDGTQEATIIGASEAESRFLNSYVWVGVVEGRYQRMITDAEGKCSFRYQSHGYQKSIQLTSFDCRIAK